MPTIQGQPATVPELVVAKELDRLEIGYQFQSSFLGGTTQRGGLVADFYLPSHSTIISVLGEYWHSSPESIARDITQKIAILSQGITTIFIREEDALKRPRYFVEQALLGNDLSGVKL